MGKAVAAALVAGGLEDSYRPTLRPPHQSYFLPASWWQDTETLAAVSLKGEDWQRLVSSQNCQEGWRIGSNWVVSHSRDPGTTQE